MYNSLVCSPSLSQDLAVRARSQKQNLLPPWRWPGQYFNSRESSRLANCSPLHVSVHCRVVLYSPPKKLEFVPVASVTAGGHRDCPVLAPVAQWPEIQPLVSLTVTGFGLVSIVITRAPSNFLISLQQFSLMPTS